jgi:hypothetical protein
MYMIFVSFDNLLRFIDVLPRHESARRILSVVGKLRRMCTFLDIVIHGDFICCLNASVKIRRVSRCI